MYRSDILIYSTVMSSPQNGHYSHKSSRCIYRGNVKPSKYNRSHPSMLSNAACNLVGAVSACTLNTLRPEGNSKSVSRCTLSDHYSHPKSSAESLISPFCIPSILILYNNESPFSTMINSRLFLSTSLISLLHVVLLTPAGRTRRPQLLASALI